MTGTQLGRNWDATGTLPSRVRLYRNQALQMKVKNAETSRTIPSCAVPDSGIIEWDLLDKQFPSISYGRYFGPTSDINY